MGKIGEKIMKLGPEQNVPDADENGHLFDRDGRPRDLRLLPDSRETQPTRHASSNAQQRLRSKFRI